MGFDPKYLIYHDYAIDPRRGAKHFKTMKNPYHVLVDNNGNVRYRNPSNPYGQRAPHAYKMNGHSIGLSWAGNFGGRPSRAALKSLRAERDKILKRYPNLKTWGHGEAYQNTKGTRLQASKLGRGVEEASWRKNLDLPSLAPMVSPKPELVRNGVMPTPAPPTMAAPPNVVAPHRPGNHHDGVDPMGAVAPIAGDHHQGMAAPTNYQSPHAQVAPPNQVAPHYPGNHHPGVDPVNPAQPHTQTGSPLTGMAAPPATQPTGQPQWMANNKIKWGNGQFSGWRS